MQLLENFGILILPSAFIIWVALFYIRRYPQRFSHWSNPPHLRKTQYCLSLLGFIISLILLFFWGIILFLDPSSVRVPIGPLLLVITISCFSGLKKPKANYITLIALALIYVFSTFGKPQPPKMYHDVCNELRIDENCFEKDNSFECSNSKLHLEKFYSKELCLNHEGTDREFFMSYRSPLVGRTLRNSVPMLYLKNLPRSGCGYRECGFKVDTKIDRLKKMCGNCLGPHKLTTKLRMNFIPANSEFKVIDSYTVNSRKHAEDSNNKYLLLADKNGTVSEILEAFYDTYFNDRNHDHEYETMIVNDVKSIQEFKSLQKKMCIRSSSIKLDKNWMEDGFKKFSDDFRLKDELQVKSIFKDNSNDKICGVINFQTEAAYLLTVYYLREWDLPLDFEPE